VGIGIDFSTAYWHVVVSSAGAGLPEEKDHFPEKYPECN
jgi:hypothetical protein